MVYTGISMFILKKRYTSALLADIESLPSSQKKTGAVPERSQGGNGVLSKKSIWKRTYQEALLSMDLILFLLFSESVGQYELGFFSLVQTECLIYTLVLPLAILTFGEIEFKPKETTKNTVFLLLGTLL